MKLIGLEIKDDSYGYRYVSPDSIRFKGAFKHNRHHPFRISLFQSQKEADVYSGKERADRFGYLSAMAVVISAHRQNPVDEYPLADGDLIHFYDLNAKDPAQMSLGVYMLRDDVGLHDPMLYRVDV